ncbi:hypothetical protein CLIB1423_07S05006 [[Candida] railenensis]|uniref:Uncharacterized protein n=1 Tax=[Candida] railenensis TaxID=45579 RepID=A0A9P0VY61_9ASCO|nr:hypothetical protein CLIB1423_07S05006 [[Candida] railenensis]
MSVSSFKGRKVEDFSRKRSDTSSKASTNNKMPDENVHPSGSSNSGSTPSLPLSIPYYYIANHTDSFDTVNLLNGENEQPQYSNTSHLNIPSHSPAKQQQPAYTPQLSSQQQQPLAHPQEQFLQQPQQQQHQQQQHHRQHQNQNQQQQQPQYQQQYQQEQAFQFQQTRQQPQVTIDKMKDEGGHERTSSNGTGTLFNQVPKRFSQFILDQQNPYMAQRLDHLSMNSISLYSGGTPSYMESHIQSGYNYTNNSSSNPNHGKKAGMKTGSTTTSSNPKNKSSTTDSIHRDISESMGSQATIFSTRPQDNDTNSSGINNLKRRKAVRSKEGGLMYRFQLRMRRIAKKMKYIFTVKRKKTVKPIGPTEERRRFRSLLRRSNRTAANSKMKKKKQDVSASDLKKSMKKSLSMRLPKSKSKTISISAPTQNLDLGGGSELVPMDSRLKLRAGLQDANKNELVDLPTEEDSIRRKTLSPPAIVPSSNPLTRAGKFTTRKAPPPPAVPTKQQQQQQQPEPAQLAAVSAALQKHVAASKSNATLQKSNADALDAAAANARALSDHLPGSAVVRKSLYATVVDQMEEESLVEAWKNYLSHVIASRIKLRQEINFYQSLKKESTESNYKFGIETEDEQSRAGSQADFSRVPSHMGSQATFAKSIPITTRTVSEDTSNSKFTQPGVNMKSSNSSRNTSSSTNYSNAPRGFSSVSHKLSVKSFAPTMTTNAESDEEDEDDHSVISILDPTAEEFNRSFANRHSMLGEMLDYQSDTTSIASSQGSTATETGSRATHTTESASNILPSAVLSNEDIGIGMRYGTVIRRSSPSKKSASGSKTHLLSHSSSEGEGEKSSSGSAGKSNGSTISINKVGQRPISLKRSQGFRVGLNSAASLEVL